MSRNFTKRLGCKMSSAFTLIEMLIALMIFSIGLLGVAGMQLTALQGNSKAQNTTAASVAASSVMEELMAMPPDSAILLTDATDVVWNYGGSMPGTDDVAVLVDVERDVPVSGVATVTVSATASGNNTVYVGYKRIMYE